MIRRALRILLIGITLVVGHPDKSLIDDSARFRPVTGGMSEITSPQERFNADV